MSAWSIVCTRPWPYGCGREGAGFASRIRPLAGMARLLALLRRKYRVYRGTRELMRLNDRMLHDIGVDRGAIEHVGRTGLDPA